MHDLGVMNLPFCCQRPVLSRHKMGVVTLMGPISYRVDEMIGMADNLM